MRLVGFPLTLSLIVRFKFNCSEDSSTELQNNTMKGSETKRQSDAKTVQRAFAMNKKVYIFYDSCFFGIFTVIILN